MPIGPSHSGSSGEPKKKRLKSYYRCSMCNPPHNWPYQPKYAVCMECHRACSACTTADHKIIMTDEEAKSLVSHLKFAHYLEYETDEQKLKRAKMIDDRDQAREDQMAAQRKQFAQVIKGAGFTAAELQRWKELEDQLPMAHRDQS